MPQSSAWTDPSGSSLEADRPTILRHAQVHSMHFPSGWSCLGFWSRRNPRRVVPIGFTRRSAFWKDTRIRHSATGRRMAGSRHAAVPPVKQPPRSDPALARHPCALPKAALVADDHHGCRARSPELRMRVPFHAQLFRPTIPKLVRVSGFSAERGV